MTKGTPSKGKRSGKKTHVICRRCGGHTYHAQHKECASCGFGKTKTIRRFSWQTKRKFGFMKGVNLSKLAPKSLRGRASSAKRKHNK